MIIEFMPRGQFDVQDDRIKLHTQVLMKTKDGKYILGQVKYDKQENKRYVSNDYYAKEYAIL